VEQARFRVISDGQVDLVHVEGVLDMATAPRLRTVIENCLNAGGQHLVVDVAAVDLLDCSAIGTLIRMRGRAGQAGGSLRLVGARGMVLEVLEISGVAKSLGAYDEVEDALPDRGGSGDDTANVLLQMMAELPEDAPERAHLRQEAIEHCLPYAIGLARRFRDRGEPLEDLSQVATIGLVKAIDGYDPAVGSEFTAYATPTIVGEVRRYFRDKGWRIRVPRRLQEMLLLMRSREGELTQRLGRSPGVADFAEHLGVPAAEIGQALEAARGYSPASLSAPLSRDSEAVVGDPLGDLDPQMEAVEARETLRGLVRQLPQREQRIVTLRFFGNKTQAEIATEIGVSQMHVSRLLAHALSQLRAALVAE
jgi:RNA polymerase sigma-B factor